MLKGKSALVTGSTSGIGLAIAKALAGQGCNVMLNGFGEASAIAATKQDVAAAGGGRVEYHGADMSNAAEIEQMMQAAGQAFGGIDILVNNAGIQHTAPVQDFPTEKWDAIIAINLTSAFHTTRLAIPMMKKRGWGRIINTGSVHSLVGSVNKSAYVAAKHGIAGLTKVTALENAGSGITINAFCPGFVRTPLIEQQIKDRAANLNLSMEEAGRELLREKQPSQSFVETDHIAGLVLFLCSDAAAQITGASIPIDGGWTAQ